MDSLPLEILNHVCDLLVGQSSLVKLVQINTKFYALIRPKIWEHIELHDPGFHEYFLYDESYDHDSVLENHKARPYHHLSDVMRSTYEERDNVMYRDHIVPAFIQAIHHSTTLSPRFVDYIPSRVLVKSLCLETCEMTDYLSADDVWSILPKLCSLERLEVIAGWEPLDDPNNDWFDESKHVAWEPLSKLQHLSLKGYVPKSIVRYLCANPEAIEELELGIFDRPIGSVTNKLAEVDKADDDEDGDNDDFSISSEPTDYPAEEFVSPRPSAALLGCGLIARFKNLKSLSLLRPMSPLLVDDDNMFMIDSIAGYVSERCQRKILSEWKELIAISRSSLQHLNLDQRPACEDIIEDSSGNAEFLYSYTYGQGYHDFKQQVLPTLIESEDWPNLVSIRIYGFDVPLDYSKQSHYPVTTFRDVDGTRLDEILQERFGSNVNVRSGIGRRITFARENGEVYLRDGFGSDAIKLDPESQT